MPSLPFKYELGQRVWYEKASPLVTEPWMITHREYCEDRHGSIVSYGMRPTTQLQAMVTWALESELWAVREEDTQHG